MFKNFSIIHTVSLILVIIGGINWGLVGLFNLNLVSAIFGIDSFFSRLIYILIGVGAAYLIYDKFKRKF